MPSYDYRCLNCNRRFNIFMSYSEYGNRQVTCTHCGSTNVQRRIGRIRVLRSEDSRFEDMADPAMLEGLEEDPRAMGRMMRKMSAEMGEDLGPEFNEVIGRLEAGQSPEEIEAAVPEIGNMAEGGSNFDSADEF